jgi:dTDP-4-dehydrorhamnose reductase
VPAAQALAAHAQARGARLLHFSTDLVFDGEHAPYGDDSPPAPITDYGAAKAEAERVVRELNPTAIIVRPSLIYGFQPLDAQTTWLVEGMRRGETVRLFTDEYRCPVWVHDLSAAILELAGPAAPQPAGPLNLGGPQPLNRWDFGMKMLAALGLAPGPNVVAATIAESGLNRARDLTMRGDRAAQLLRTRLRPVDEAASLHRSTAS